MITAEIRAALAKPFPEHCVSWKPAATNEGKTKALAVAYVAARDVAERLDEATDGNWEFHWREDGTNAHGSLTVCGTTRQDVGEQGDSELGATRKAAVSDALKRCAVQFGVGRYLYNLPATWVAYDSHRKRLSEFPELPAWACPGGGERVAAPSEAPERSSEAPVQSPVSPQQTMCPVHNVSTYRREKDGEHWYSHKTDDGWCNELPERPFKDVHWTQNQDQYNQAWGILKGICLEYNAEMTAAEVLVEVLAVAGVDALSDYRGMADTLAKGLRERMSEPTVEPIEVTEDDDEPY